MKIAVDGTGYLDLGLSALLTQHNEAIAVDVIQEKVNRFNEWKSPNGDE